MTEREPVTIVGEVSRPHDSDRDKKGTKLRTLGVFTAGVAMASTWFLIYENSQPENNNTTSLSSTVEGCVDTTKATQAEKKTEIDSRVTAANQALDDAQAKGEGIAVAAEELETVRTETTKAISALATETQVIFDTCLTDGVQSLLGEAGVNTGVELTDVMMPIATNGTEG